MAQPVFDGHPLEEYFQDSGEAAELVPGGAPDFALQPYLTGQPPSTSRHAESVERLCFLMFSSLQSLRPFFAPDFASLRAKAFAERFKYGVISSSLLSPAMVATSMAESHRRGVNPSLPGKLPSHSRSSSAADSVLSDTLSLSIPPDHESPIWPFTLSFTVVIAALSAQFYFFACLLLVATLYYIHVHRRDIHAKPDVMTPSLLALQHLISAGHIWDTVINDTFTILENEEQSIFYGHSTPLMPSSSSLRVALSTSLLTTQTQCDNVRRLLSAITSPSELAQLAEMYAPPSPIKPTFPRSSNESSRRPLSHPGSPRGGGAGGPGPGPSGSSNTPTTDRTKKRSTWNGSYVSLALSAAGSPSSFQLAQHREKRRSDLSVLTGTPTPSPSRSRTRGGHTTASGSSSPQQQLLADVSEEEGGMVTAAESSVADDDEAEMENSFGAAALSLYRNRLNGGLRAFELPSLSLSPSLLKTPQRNRSAQMVSLTPTPARNLTTTATMTTRPRTTMSPGSKYTSSMHAHAHATRHLFSLSSLRQALQNALASKRFACSHLLALRFEDDEDEAYWEDVRAVMDLLTSTLVDASSRLSEVLDEVEERAMRMSVRLGDVGASDGDGDEDEGVGVGLGNEEENGNENGLARSEPPTPPPPSQALSLPQSSQLRSRQTLSDSFSFAPTPTHLARFAAHVGVISAALDDAREQLERCVAALKEEKERTMMDGLGGGDMSMSPSGSSSAHSHSHSFGHSSHPSSSSRSDVHGSPGVALSVPGGTGADAGIGIGDESGKGSRDGNGGGIGDAEPVEVDQHHRHNECNHRDCVRDHNYDRHHDHPAIRAYERLRRELGLALRECERGRERLMHVVMPPTPSTEQEEADIAEVSGAKDGLGGRKSEGADVEPSLGLGLDLDLQGLGVDEEQKDLGTELEHERDDATKRLLLATSPAHLPPAGIEQVFEAESGPGSGGVQVGAFARERSGLSRAERIERAKARRAARLSSSSSPPPLPPPLLPSALSPEVMGPSEDVVRELKDVIWKVGQRRQKMVVEAESAPAAAPAPAPIPGSIATLVPVPVPVTTSTSEIGIEIEDEEGVNVS